MSKEFEFDRKEYAKAFDEIKLSEGQKSCLISKVKRSSASTRSSGRQIDIIEPSLPDRFGAASHKVSNTASAEESKEANRKRTGFKVWTRAVAAVLTLALIGGALYFFTGSETNSFVIVANAAETENADVVIKSDLLAGTYAPSVFERNDSINYSSDKYGYDWFEHFSLSELNIKGKNIDTVTFKANKNFTYFALFPNEGASDTNQPPISNKSFYDAVAKSYDSIMPFTHSHYHEKSYEDEPFGADAYGKMCDGFVYKNPNSADEEQTLNIGNSMYFCLETDRTDASIDGIVTEMEQYQKKLQEIMENHNEEAKSDGVYKWSDEENSYLVKFDEYRKMLIEKMLDGASIDVTVKFSDGTEQTKVLELSYKGLQDDKLSVSVKIS